MLKQLKNFDVLNPGDKIYSPTIFGINLRQFVCLYPDDPYYGIFLKEDFETCLKISESTFKSEKWYKKPSEQTETEFFNELTSERINQLLQIIEAIGKKFI
jgi:hypothetical protein